MAIRLSLLSRKIVLQKQQQNISIWPSALTNIFPTCNHQLLVRVAAATPIFRTPLVGLQTKATGSQQNTKVERTQEKKLDIKVFDEFGNFISLMSKEKALKLAKSKELKLVEIVSSSSSKSSKEPLSYQFMTGKQLYENRLKEREARKEKTPKSDLKTLTLNANISDHDFAIKINKMLNLLEKNFELKILIKTNSSNEENARKQQSSFLKKITEELVEIATVKKASSSEKELILILKRKKI